MSAHGRSAARTGVRDGTRGEGAPAKALETNGASPALPRGVYRSPFHAFSARRRSGPSAGGVAEETPGTIGTVFPRRRTAWRAPTGAGAAPSPRDPGGLEHAPSGEGMGGVYGGFGGGWMKRGRIFSGQAAHECRMHAADQNRADKERRREQEKVLQKIWKMDMAVKARRGRASPAIGRLGQRSSEEA